MIDPMNRFTYKNIRKIESTDKVNREKNKKDQEGKKDPPKQEVKNHENLDQKRDGLDFYA